MKRVNNTYILSINDIQYNIFLYLAVKDNRSEKRKTHIYLDTSYLLIRDVGVGSLTSSFLYKKYTGQ